MTKITIVSSDEIDSYPEEIQEILTAIGHPEAMVTDESMLWDFMCFFDKESDETKQYNQSIETAVSKLVHRDVTDSETLLELAKSLRHINSKHKKTSRP